MVAVAVQKCKLHNRIALFVLTVVPPQPCWLFLFCIIFKFLLIQLIFSNFQKIFFSMKKNKHLYFDIRLFSYRNDVCGIKVVVIFNIWLSVIKTSTF